MDVQASENAVASPFIPCLVVFIVAYAAGALFLSVYDITIDSMLLCFIYDEEHDILKHNPDLRTDLRNLAADVNSKMGPPAGAPPPQSALAADAQTSLSPEEHSDERPVY